MTAASPARARKNAPRLIHLPSVHKRGMEGRIAGYDYSEDSVIAGDHAERTLTFTALNADGSVIFERKTRDVLGVWELQEFRDNLPFLMDEADPELQLYMEERAHREFTRQVRIIVGRETACVRCGCSDSRSCSGGCLWATATLCSRCAL